MPLGALAQVLFCSGQIRLFLEALDQPRITLESIPEFQVSKASSRSRGLDAKGDQRFRVRLHNTQSLANDSPKALLGLDKLISGDHGDRRLRVNFRDDGASETDGVQSVSALGLAQKLASGKAFELMEDEIMMPLASTDEAPVRFDQTFKTLKGQREWAFPLDKRYELLGEFFTAHGP